MDDVLIDDPELEWWDSAEAAFGSLGLAHLLIEAKYLAPLDPLTPELVKHLVEAIGQFERGEGRTTVDQIHR